MGKKCDPRKCYFHPKMSPRLCPYLVKRVEWENDLKMYNRHLKRVFDAKPLIDASPLPLSVLSRLRPTKLNEDASRVDDIDRENKRMLKRLIEINRCGGELDHINEYCYYSRITKWAAERRRREILSLENRKMHERLSEARPHYGREEQEEEWKRTLRLFKKTSKFPFMLAKKPSLDESLRAEPTISGNLEKLGPRFECYLDFEVQNGEYLGRIIVQLYDDHAPVTVRNFLDICRGESGLTYENCPVHRIVKDRFLETGDITKGNGKGGTSIYGKNFDEEKHMLKHTKGGVLSMVREGNQKNNSKFCITFMNMEELDKKNVVFGKVTSGANVLMKISGYGRRIGKPLKNIIISKCGELPPCNCKQKNSDYTCL